MRRGLFTAAGCAVVTALGACGSDDSGSTTPQAGATGLPQGGQTFKLDPAEFTARIDNPYLPLAPGTTWVYREVDGEGGPAQRVEVTVTNRTKRIAGIQARVVRDLATEGGKPVEDTIDWYAQDRAGNVWYLGEDTKEYKDGKVVSTSGSWQTGVDGAQAGIALPGHPAPGMAYRQEYYRGEAEDAARVLSINERIAVPVGKFANALLTRDYTPLDPLVEHKYYVKGIGQVLAVDQSGGTGRQELVSFTRPQPRRTGH